MPLMGQFIKSQILKEKAGNHLLRVEFTEQENQLPISKTEVGEKTRTALSKLPEDTLKASLLGMKSFYVDNMMYLVKHLPIGSKLLRDVSFLHPQLGRNDHSIEAVRRIAVMLRTVSDEEVALITYESEMLQSGDEVVDTSQRVDHYWAIAFQEKSSEDQFRYSILPKLVKSVLFLARGNADVERGLSANN